MNGYPKNVKLYRNSSQDTKYETTWETIDNKTFSIPSSDIKTMYSLLKAKGIIVVDNMLNLSNILGMIIKRNTLEKKIESIKEEI